MSKMLYSRCSICEGSLKSDICTGGVCICTRSETPGWSPIGITEGQLEKMVELHRVLQLDPAVPKATARKVLREIKLKMAAWFAAFGPD